MIAKVVVIKHGSPKREITFRCPDCEHINSIISEEIEGELMCWFCGAVLKWELVDDAGIENKREG